MIVDQQYTGQKLAPLIKRQIQQSPIQDESVETVDGNPATTELAGWRPLLITTNHLEYPAAHGLDTDRIEVDVHGFDAAGAVGNLDAVQHFKKARDLRKQIVDARFWAGLHYRPSAEAGVELGRDVARFDLRHAFRELDE